MRGIPCRLFTFILILSLFPSCNRWKNDTVKKPIYVIPKINFQEELKKLPSPFLLYNYYGQKNIIFDGDACFIFSIPFNGYENCMSTPVDTLPRLLYYLFPKDIKLIDYKSLKDSIKNNQKENLKYMYSISATKDSVYNENFVRLIDLIRRFEIKRYVIRHTTEQEDTLLMYKKLDKEYKPNKINWKSTQLQQQIEFILPIILD